jgi:glucoamylase
VGTALGEASPVWFTIGCGVVEEVYFPRADQPHTRNLVLAVAGEEDFLSCEQTDAESETSPVEPGVWPLLAGERGHSELAAGRPREAGRMLRLMEAAATDAGLIPEQVWDADDIPGRGLFRGRPTGSACPLAWAHAEYLKLARSLRDGAVFDLPRQAARRYGNGHARPRLRVWRFNDKIGEMPAGFRLRVEAAAPAVVRWSPDGWKDVREVEAADTGLGVYTADLRTEDIAPGGGVVFTFHWTGAGRWEGSDFRVAIARPGSGH